MKVVDPRAITDAILTSSTVPETDYPDWSAIISYAAGARVIRAHRIYESLGADNLGYDPASSPERWAEIGSTNRWAMFDEAVGSVTSALGLIEITLAPGAAIDAIGALDTDAASMRVRILDGGEPIYDETKGGAGDPANPASILFFDLPEVDDAQVIITLEAAGGFGVGTLIIGTLVDLGVTEAGPSIGINDFSRRATDDFGVTTIVERAWSKRMTLRSMFPTDSVDLVQRLLADLRAKACLWIGEEGYDSLVIYGYFKEFSIDLAFETISYCSITVEGLTKAAQILAVQSPLAAYLTNESVTLPADDSGHVVNYDEATGEFVIFAGLTNVSTLFELSTLANPKDLTVAYGGMGETGQMYAVTDGMDPVEGAAIVIRAVGTGDFAGIVVDKQFSLSKASGGASAKLLAVLSDRQTISYDAAGDPSPAIQTTVLSVNKQNTNATVHWTITDAAGAARYPVADFLSDDEGDTVTMTEPQFDTARNGTSGVIITATLTDGVTVRDKISIVRVQAGVKGDPGDAGLPGPPGADGQSLFTHYAFADSDDGELHFTTGAPGNRIYIGVAANMPSPIESSDPEDYVWTRYAGPPGFGLVASAGAIVMGNRIMRTAADNPSNEWDEGVYSTEAFTGGAFVAFKRNSASIAAFIGLNQDPLAGADDWTRLDYALYLADNGSIYYAESGALVLLSTHAVGDTVGIQYDNRNVRYYKNGALLRTVAAPSNLTFYLDSCLGFQNVDVGEIVTWAAAGAAGNDGLPGAPGTPGRDAILGRGLSSAGFPASPAAEDTWYFTDTKTWWQYRVGIGWVQLLGAIAAFDALSASYIVAGTITADRFLTNAGVDLAAIVPGSIIASSNVTQVGYYDITSAAYELDTAQLAVPSINDPLFISVEFQLISGNTTGNIIIQRFVNGAFDATLVTISSSASLGTYRFDYRDNAHPAANISYRLRVDRNAGTILTVSGAKAGFVRLAAK